MSAETQQQLNQAFEQGVSILEQYIALGKQETQLVNEFNKKRDVLTSVGFGVSKENKLSYNEQDFQEKGIIDQNSKLTAGAAAALNKQLGINVKAGENFDNVVKKLEADLAKLNRQFEKNTKDSAEAAATVKTLINSYNELDRAVRLENFVNATTKALGTIGQLVMGVQMLQTAFNNFNDETIEDPIERFNQGIIDLSFGATMLLPIFSNLIKHHVEYRKAVIAAEEAQALFNKVKKEGAVIDVAGEIIEVATATERLRKAQEDVKKLQIGSYFSKAKDMLVDFGKKIKDVIGALALSAPGKIGLTIAALSALGAAVAGVITLYKNFFSEEAKVKKQQEEFTKKIQEQAAAYSKAKDDYNELISTVADYKDARDALKDLTEGSEEWRKKIGEIDSLVDGLIQKYPDLANKILPSADGGWYIPENLIDQTISQANQQQYQTGMKLAFTNSRTPQTNKELIQQDMDQGRRYLIQAGTGLARDSGVNFDAYGGAEAAMAALFGSETYVNSLREHYLNPVSNNLLTTGFSENEIAFNPEEATDLTDMYSKLFGDLSNYTFDSGNGKVVVISKEDIQNLDDLVFLTSGNSNYRISEAATGANMTDLDAAYEEYALKRAKAAVNYGPELLDRFETGEQIVFPTEAQANEFKYRAEATGYSKYYPDQFNNVTSLEQQYRTELIGTNRELSEGNDSIFEKYSKAAGYSSEGYEVDIIDEAREKAVSLIDAVGGINNYILNEDAILSMVSQGLSQDQIAEEVNISEWQSSVDDVQKSLDNLFGDDILLLDNTVKAIAEANNLEDADEEVQKRVANLVFLSKQAAQNLLEGYEENLEKFNSDDITVSAEGLTFFQKQLSDLLMIPLPEVVNSGFAENLLNDEDFNFEGLWSGDSQALAEAREAFLESVGINFHLPEGEEFNFDEFYDQVQSKLEAGISAEGLSNVINSKIEDLELTPQDKEQFLAALGLKEIGEDEKGHSLFAPIETGTAEAEVALSDFATSLVNTGLTVEQAQEVENTYRTDLEEMGFSDGDIEKILAASVSTPALLNTKNTQQIKNLYGEGQNGYTIEEAISEVAENIKNNNWFSNQEGWSKKAQELGLSLEEFKKQVEQYAEENGLENLEIAAQGLADKLQAEIDEDNQIRENAFSTIKGMREFGNDEDIQAAIDQLQTDQIQGYIEWLQKNADRAANTTSATEYQESLDTTPWWADTERQAEHIREEGYDSEKYDQYYQEFLEKYNHNVQMAATLAEAKIKGEQYLSELEEEEAEAKQERLDAEQRQIDAIEAGKGLAEQYQSEEGFSLTDNWEDTGKLRDFRESLATMLGMSLEDSLDVFDDAELVEIANSKEFQEVMKGNTAYIGQLAQTLSDAGLKSLDLETDIGTLFTIIGQKIEETEEVVTRSLQEIITNFLQIVQDLNEGDIISEDEYGALVEQLGSEAVDQYFTTMADGTHMLVGAADEFKQNAMNVARVQIGQQLEQAIAKEQQTSWDHREDLGFGRYKSDDVKMFTEMEFSTAETLEQLQHFAEATEKMGVSSKIILDAYNENLLRLGMNYENATDEVKAFKEAQASGNEENIAAAQRDLEGSIAIGQDESLGELGLDASEIDDYADHLQDLAAMEEDAYLGGEKLADSLEEDEDAAAMLSKHLSRMNRGVESLEKNWDDWADILQNSSKGSKEYFDAMQSTRSAMSDLLDVSEDFISADLVDSLANNAENMELMQRAAEGDGEAIDQLRQLALDDIIVKITEDNQLNPEFLSSQVAAIQDMIPDIEVGATVDDSALIDALNDMIVNAGLTKDQVNALLGSMGFDANFVTEQQPVETTVPIYTTHHAIVNEKTEKVGKEPNASTVTTFDESTWTEVTGHHTVEGAAAEFAMSTSAPGEGGGTPQLSSITRKASGSANNYSGSNRGGNSGGGGGKGGGGGGGGGAKETKTNEADPIEKEKDRYQKVNEQIAKTVALYNKLTEAQERLIGPDLVANLADQNEKLEEQVDLQKEKLRIQREEQRDRQKDLTQYGIQFNSDGTISNYSEVWDAQINKLEAARQAYNGTSTEDEAAKENWEAAQKYFEDFEEGITKYDSLLENIYDTNAEIQKLRNAMDDLSKSIVDSAYDAIDALEKLNDSMQEVELNIADPLGNNIWAQLESAGKGISDFFQMNEEQASAAYNTLIDKAQELIDSTESDTEKQALIEYRNMLSTDLNAGDTGYLDMWNNLSEGLIQEYNDLINTGSNKSNLSGGSLKELMDTAFSSGVDLLGNLTKKIQDLHDAALDGIKEIGEELEQRNDNFENISNELEHQLDLAQMLYGETAYQQQDQIYRAQLRNSEAQLSMASQTIKLYESMLNEMTEGTEEWKEVHDKLIDAQKQYNDLIKEAVKYSQQLYENTVNNQLDQWIKDALGNDIEWIQEEWELIQRNANQYYDEVEKAYNIRKLQGRYESLLNQSSQLSIQQQITNQMNQQLDYLNNKNELSKYDIEYANAQLEILQRQIALEEAQYNKNQMRLTRDSQGNYTYTYTSNREDINSANEELLDSLSNAYELSKQTIIDSQSDALSALKDFYSEVQGIATNYSLSEEERSARLQELWDLNRDYLEGCAEQLGVSFYNIQDDYYDLTDFLQNGFYSTTNNVQNNLYETLGIAKDSVGQAAGDIQNSVGQAAGNIQNSVGQAAGDIQGNVNSSLNGIQDQINNITTGTIDNVSKMDEEIAKILDPKENNRAKITLDQLIEALQNKGQNWTGKDGFSNDVSSMIGVIGGFISTGTTGWLTNITDFSTNTDTLMNDLNKDMTNYGNNVTTISDTAKTDITDLTPVITDCVNATNDLKNAQADFFSLLQNQSGTVTEYLKTMQGYASTISNLEGGMKKYRDTIDKLKATLAENYISYEINGERVVNNRPTETKKATSSAGKANGSNQKAGGNASAKTNGANTKGVQVTEDLVEGIAGNIWGFGSWGEEPVRQANLQKKFGQQQGTNIFNQVQNLFNSGYGYSYDPKHLNWNAQTPEELYQYYRKYDMSRFDTGGYTGEWNDGSGKVAMLHSKELVLNAKDTENMLAAIKLVREAVNSMQKAGLSFRSPQLLNQASPIESTVDQNVTITANFPNATSENEIRSAILGLVDQSVQYSSRFKPNGKVI